MATGVGNEGHLWLVVRLQYQTVGCVGFTVNMGNSVIPLPCSHTALH